MKKRIGGAILGPGGAQLPLSAAIELEGLIFVSGQLALREGVISGADVQEQTEIAIDALEGILIEAGLTLGDIVKTTIWLARQEDFAAFNAIYGRRFRPPYPARATVVSALALPGALVEIEAIAVRPVI